MKKQCNNFNQLGERWVITMGVKDYEEESKIHNQNGFRRIKEKNIYLK